MAFGIDDQERLDRLLAQMRDTMDIAACSRMDLMARCAAAVHGWGPLPSASQIREADTVGALVEEIWTALDAHLRETVGLTRLDFKDREPANDPGPRSSDVVLQARLLRAEVQRTRRELRHSMAWLQEQGDQRQLRAQPSARADAGTNTKSASVSGSRIIIS